MLKGLGTSGPADAKQYFSNLPRHRKPFRPVQDGERQLIDMAFNKRKADDRKEWLRQFQVGCLLNIYPANFQPWTHFLIVFAKYSLALIWIIPLEKSLL